MSFSLENLNKTIDPLVGGRRSGFCSQGSKIPEAGPSRQRGADCHSEKSERERPSVCFLPRACCCGASRRGSGSGTWVQVLPNPKPVSELMILTGGIKRSPTSTSWNLFIPHIGSESRKLCPDSLRPHDLYSPWNSPGQNTGSLSLLHGIFLTQGSNPGLLHCRQILYRLSRRGRPTVGPCWFCFINRMCIC